MSDLKSAFEQAQADVKTLTERPSNDDLLALYAHFKQATDGDVSGKRPGITNPVGRYKHDAWAAISGMSADEAMQAYVDAVDEVARKHAS